MRKTTINVRWYLFPNNDHSLAEEFPNFSEVTLKSNETIEKRLNTHCLTAEKNWVYSVWSHVSAKLAGNSLTNKRHIKNRHPMNRARLATSLIAVHRRTNEMMTNREQATATSCSSQPLTCTKFKSRISGRKYIPWKQFKIPSESYFRYFPSQEVVRLSFEARSPWPSSSKKIASKLGSSRRDSRRVTAALPRNSELFSPWMTNSVSLSRDSYRSDRYSSAR